MIGNLLGGMTGIHGLIGVRHQPRREQNSLALINAMYAQSYEGRHREGAMMMNTRPSPRMKECAYCGREGSGESCLGCGAGRWKA